MSFSSRLSARVSFLSRPRSAVLLGAAAACMSMAFACGGISDPTKEGEKVATVSGALIGTSVPAGARVALVWRTASSSSTSGGYAVGDDVPVVAGKFTMSLAVPAAAYFSSLDSDTNFGDTPVATDVPPPTRTDDSTGVGSTPGSSSSGSGGKAFHAVVTPKDNVSGTVITAPLSAAVAGFVIYVDTNGNGKLDLTGAYASTTDTVLGGNRDLTLTYLKDGGGLDYEKLRDRSGILPTAGFNLAWISESRWVGLNLVELKLDATQGLPYSVCSTSGSNSGSGGGSVDPVASTPPSSGTGGTFGGSPEPADPDAPSGSSSSGGGGSAPSGGYPDPSDPNLKCAPDGRSFSYQVVNDCPAPTPAPEGLCSNSYGDIAIACAPSYGYGAALPSDGTVPEGWPCTVTGDGGTVDGGAADGGAADAGGK